MIARVAGELDRLHERTDFTGDDDLVFAHPILGSVRDASKLRKRFQDSVARAGRSIGPLPRPPAHVGTEAAAAGVPLRTLQEWMGHRDYKTTLIYAGYAPRTYERELMERAFRLGPLVGSTEMGGAGEPRSSQPHRAADKKDGRRRH